MPLSYVTVTEQKEYSQIQHTALDDPISLLINAASAQVKNYLKDFSPYEGLRNDDDDYVVDSQYEPVNAPDSNGEQVVKPEVKVAVLFLVDRMIKKPKESPQEIGRLPVEAEVMLYPLRDPALK